MAHYMDGLDPVNYPETDDLRTNAEKRNPGDLFTAEQVTQAALYNRLPCGCPLDSGCNGYHSLYD